MFLDQWVEFSWDLRKLPDSVKGATRRARLRLGSEDDDPRRLWNIIRRVYATDMSWGSGREQRLDQIKSPVLNGLDGERLAVLLLEDGRRIIGISGLNIKGSPQLVTGICVIEEYRCRRYGTELLYTSLKFLADAGLSEASVITKAKTYAAKYLYPKFSSAMRLVSADKVDLKKEEHLQEIVS